MTPVPLRVNDRIVTLLGRKGTLVSVERIWLTAIFDDSPDWAQCFHAADRWILRDQGNHDA